MAKVEVKTGIDVLLEKGPATLLGLEVGLITNHTGVTKSLRSSIDSLLAAGVRLKALFGPEHGVRGNVQDGKSVGHFVDEPTGLPVYSLYGETERPTPEMLDGLDALVCDIQDAGVRFYTYIYTMAYSLAAASQLGLKFVVLDRPNPITGTVVEGSRIEADHDSFVGGYGLPFRYGMTIGELAYYLNERQGWRGELEVVRAQGWRRHLWYDQTDLPWVLPSPNLPTLDTAVVYPGTVLFEGTNVSEGRGTTRPFELIGAPWIDASRALELIRRRFEEFGVCGALLREAHFLPTFSKHEGAACHGFQIHVTDRDAYRPVTAAIICLKVIRDLHRADFEWRPFPDKSLAIDRLAGTALLRHMVDQEAPLDELLERLTAGASQFAREREPFLLY